MDEINRFLSNFKKLESELVKLSSLDDDYISFSRALSNVYQRKINDVVSDEDNYDILKQASDLRNILSHENNVCIPTSSFNEKFEEIVDAIVNPLTCLDIATLRKDLTFASVDDKITSVCKLMNERGYSNIPVYDNGKVIGVFSRTTFFDTFIRKRILVLTIIQLMTLEKKSFSPLTRRKTFFSFLEKSKRILYLTTSVRRELEIKEYL